MPEFHHERLIVYRKSVEFEAIALKMIPEIHPAYGFLRNQLGRAATSISFNIAEGSAEFSKPDKRKFYRISRRSAAECAAILDAVQLIQSREAGRIAAGKAVLYEIVAMLTVMSRPPQSECRPRDRRKNEGEAKETGE